MAAPNLANPESLDLIETGRFFRSGGSLQSRAQLKRSLPAAHERFQCALDSLSEQIFIAKTFLERDYEAVKAKKAALRPVEDVRMDEASIKDEPETAPPSSQTEAGLHTGESEMKPNDNDATPTAQTESALNQHLPDHPVKTENPVESNLEPPPAQDVSGTEELNFDSMLNDNGGPNEFDLDLDFGDDNDAGNENFLSGANFGNDIGDNQQPDHTVSGLPSTHGNGADITAGGDAFDLELQRAEAFNPDGQLDGAFGAGMEDVMAPGESSFDDLFMESENRDGDGVGDSGLLDGDGLMQINELDDSWFT